MKFGRIGLFFKKADIPQAQPQQQVPVPNVQPQTNGLGQEREDNPSQPSDTGVHETGPAKTPAQPKKNTLFRTFDDVKNEHTVFSGLDNVYAIKNIPGVQWKEEYTRALPKQPNFYRYVAYNEETKEPTHYMLIRGDKPTAAGNFNIVVDKINRSGAPARAKYFKNYQDLKQFVYDTFEIELGPMAGPDLDFIIESYVGDVRRMNSDIVLPIFKGLIDILPHTMDVGKVASGIINKALVDMVPDKAVKVINNAEHAAAGLGFDLDIAEAKAKYKRYLLNYREHKDEYKNIFDEQVPLAEAYEKPQFRTSIMNLQKAKNENNAEYVEMMKDIDVKKTEIANLTNKDIKVSDVAVGELSLTIPANDFVVMPTDLIEDSRRLPALQEQGKIKMSESKGLYIGDLATRLRKMEAYDYLIMQIASQVSETDIRFSFDVKNKTSETIKEEGKFKIGPKETLNVSAELVESSKVMQDAIAEERLVIDEKSFKEKWKGFMKPEQVKKLMDYLEGSVKSYSRFDGKGVTPFEYKMEMHHNPATWWRGTESLTPDSFRAEMKMGDIYTPLPPDYVNPPGGKDPTHDPTPDAISEHFRDNIAFGYVHEMMNDNKKVWVIDEYQSDLVQQIGKLSDAAEPKSWYNPQGKSKKARFKTYVESYYGDWYKIFLNQLIKKAKALGVDQVWMIRGKDIWNKWYGHDADPVEAQSKLQLFRRVYDGAALQYSGVPDSPEKQQAMEEYKALDSDVRRYFQQRFSVLEYVGKIKEVDPADIKDITEEEVTAVLASEGPRTAKLREKKEKLEAELRGDPALETKFKEVSRAFGEMVGQTKKPGITPEQKAEIETKIQGLKAERDSLRQQMQAGTDPAKAAKVREKIAEVDAKIKEIDGVITRWGNILARKDEVVEKGTKQDEILSSVAVMKKKDRNMPRGFYAGMFHVIDVNSVPNERLAATKSRQLTKYARIEVVATEKTPQQWAEFAYKWIQDIWTPRYIQNVPIFHEKLMSERSQKFVGLERFWIEMLPEELKYDGKVLNVILEYLREKFGIPDLDWEENVKLYIEGGLFMLIREGGDNPDPSVENNSCSPMEESNSNRNTDPNTVLYRRKKGLGGAMNDPQEGGDLKTSLPANVRDKFRTATDAVERYLVQREKAHVSEPQIKQELKDKGLSEEQIDSEYQTRSKNLYKETK